MRNYPGEFIPTVLVQRPNGTRIYMPIKDYTKSSMTTGQTFVIKATPKLERPEVYRKYRSVALGGVSGTQYHLAHPRINHYRLEEIS